MGEDTELKSLTKLTIPNLIKHQAKNYSSKPALISDVETLSFLDLDRISTNIASNIINLGILPGDRVAIWAPNMRIPKTSLCKFLRITLVFVVSKFLLVIMQNCSWICLGLPVRFNHNSRNGKAQDLRGYPYLEGTRAFRTATFRKLLTSPAL